MIIICPDCGTRYQADAAKFPAAGRKVKCAKCGHAWHQDPPAPEPALEVIPEPVDAEPPTEPSAVEPAAPEPAPVPRAVEPEPAPPEPEPAPAVDAERDPDPVPISVAEPLRPAARVPESVPVAPPVFVAPPVRIAPAVVAPTGPSLWPARLGVIVGWGFLVLLIVMVAWAGIRFRQQIASLWPQTSSFYGMLGMRVNALGIDFQGVSYAREKQDGQSVLAVTGRLVNVSGREESVPQLRAVLTDEQHRELYHWTFNAGVTTMKPGQSIKFLTRISSPPPGAKHLDVRFIEPGQQ